MKYTKRALCHSVKYSRKRDILAVVLEDDKLYTFGEIDALIANYENPKVVKPEKETTEESKKEIKQEIKQETKRETKATKLEKEQVV